MVVNGPGRSGDLRSAGSSTSRSQRALRPAAPPTIVAIAFNYRGWIRPIPCVPRGLARLSMR